MSWAEWRLRIIFTLRMNKRFGVKCCIKTIWLWSLKKTQLLIVCVFPFPAKTCSSCSLHCESLSCPHAAENFFSPETKQKLASLSANAASSFLPRATHMASPPPSPIRSIVRLYSISTWKHKRPSRSTRGAGRWREPGRPDTGHSGAWRHVIRVRRLFSLSYLHHLVVLCANLPARKEKKSDKRWKKHPLSGWDAENKGLNHERESEEPVVRRVSIGEKRERCRRDARPLAQCWNSKSAAVHCHEILTVWNLVHTFFFLNKCSFYCGFPSMFSVSWIFAWGTCGVYWAPCPSFNSASILLTPTSFAWGFRFPARATRAGFGRVDGVVFTCTQSNGNVHIHV